MAFIMSEINDEMKLEKEFHDGAKEAPPAKIKALGIGGGGIRSINRMISCCVRGVETGTVDSDSRALLSSRASNRFLIGEELTNGLGTGSDPETGRKAAEEEGFRDRIGTFFKDADIVFIAAGMGGGTGTGASPVIAEYARKAGALTVGVVTRPFLFEGKQRMTRADDGINELKASVDALIVISNDDLLQKTEMNSNSLDVFHSAMADAVCQGIQGISDIIAAPGLINGDIEDVKEFLSGAGTLLMGTGTAKGDNAAVAAAETAVRNASAVGSADGVLLNVTGGKSLSLYDFAAASDIIMKDVDPDASVLFGVIQDDNMEEDEIRVTYFVVPAAVAC